MLKNLGCFKLHWLILFLSLIITFLAWRISSNHVEINTESRFLREAEETVDSVVVRMKKYEDILWGGVATLKSHSNGFDKSEFKKFAKVLKLDEKYPGINGIGLIQKVERYDLGEFLKDKNREIEGFSIHPPRNGTVLYPIVYVEPEKINLKAIGLDMAHEKNRLEAVLKAETSGQAQVTGPIVLVQDSEKTPGFLFYAPYFNDTEPEELEGLVYAPFIFKKLMNGVLGNENELVHVNIYDGQESLYISSEEAVYEGKFLYTKVLQVYGREWSFSVTPNTLFHESSANKQSLVVLCAGVLIDLLLFLLFMALSRSKEEALSLAALMIEKAENQREKAVNASKMASLGEMAGGIAHEINNPLTILSGNAVRIKLMCERGEIDKDSLQKTCDKIERTVERMAKLIKSMRNLSRDGSDDVFISCSLHSIVTDAVNLCHERFKHNGVELSVPTVPENYFTNCRQVELSQVLINLLNNAYDAVGKSKSPSIAIKIIKTQKKRVQILISNSGPKIADEIVDKIMEPFFTTKPVGKGTGLGLSISKKIIERHNGRLFVDSYKPLTTFVIELDLIEAKKKLAS